MHGPVGRRGSLGTLARLVVLLALGQARGGVADDAIPPPEELEARGAIIGRIHVVPEDIFDTSIEGEDGWLYRTANKLHIETRPAVIRGQLLFKSGEPYRHRLVQETERILRANEFLYDANIRAVAFDGKVVDLEVRTRDVWTLNPGINFSRSGGANEVGVQIEESNLLGTGQHIQVEWSDEIDRESLTLSFRDPHFRHSFTRVAAIYSDADDGQTKSLVVQRPFYALDTRRAGGISLNDSQRNDPRYELGHKTGEFQHHDEYYQASGGWSRGLQGSWVRRWTYGYTYENDSFAVDPNEPLGGPLPEDRRFSYPWLGLELVEDRYQERRNQDQISRTEDVLVGLRAGARLGAALESLGSDRDALLIDGYVQDGVDFNHRHSLFGSVTATGRLEDEGLVNGVLSAEARYYAKTSKRSKFYASVSGAVAEDLDEDLQLLLGGDNGLRGYPLRYQAGTSRALMTLEQRYYTDWYPFRLVYVGAAAFFDMGRTWGTDVTGLESSGLLKDVGIGLRLGSSRSSFGNVIHIDLAFPLDGNGEIDDVQLLIETKGSF